MATSLQADGSIAWNAQVPVRATSVTPSAVANSNLPSNGLVISSGSSLTHTLPDPRTIRKNSRVDVKNVAASAVTVQSAFGLVDGGASVQIAQNVTKTFVTEGNNWYSWTD